jgi:hypothetical protein
VSSSIAEQITRASEEWALVYSAHNLLKLFAVRAVR